MMLSAAIALCLQADAPVDFKRDVRPILSENCFQCHGPDEKRRQAKLRLDTREGARAALKEISRRTSSTDEEERMPPAKSGKKLTKVQIDLIRKWIEQGAAWSEHWAFVPPQKSEPPKVKNLGWVRNPIDAFILARLEREGIAPSPEADKVTLLRRLSLDLTGLPPTPAEVDAFLAGEDAVERLLASPHYGERWGRHWLDAARYADSDGYEKDKSREVWFYRDWVIQAFNRDLPYDRFVIEQIAGDALPNATQDQIVATGFLRNSMINEEGGVDPEQFRMEAMFDRMDAVGKGILGLTLQCAQCHNHKYDPLTQEDYYRLFAFLNNSHEASAVVYTHEEQMRRADLLRQIREIEADRAPKQKDNPIEWTVLRPAVDDISTGGQKYLPLQDGSFIAQGYAPTKHRVKMTVKTDLPNITGFRLELMTDPNLPRGGPGRSPKGTAALTEFEVEAGGAKVKIVRATADFEPPETPLEKIYDDKSAKRRVTGPVAFAIDGKEETAWGTDAGPGRRNQTRQAVFAAEKPIANPGGTVLIFYLKQNHGGWNSDDNQNHNLGRFRISITSAPDPAAPPVPEANEKIEALWRLHPEGTAQLALTERDEVRPTHMLQRGDFLKPGKPVAPGVPGFLHPLPAGAAPTRLAFARWLVDRNSPTTARAIVNRVWQTYFGTGLVATSEDLGSQSESPSHPELLDWLAVEFMERGWSFKALHRRIATSAVYRQSSKFDARDPSNRLLARGARFRVEGEIVRDIALSASGLLNPKVGGPSVFPPAPASLFVPPASYGPKVWKEEAGDGRYRRALYTFRFRSVPYPVLQTFDAPNGDSACARRTRSNTPLQALTSLNEPLFMECAKALAERTLREGGETDELRLAWAFRRCTARTPTAREMSILLAFLKKQKPGPVAWTALARVLLNLDETITRE